LLFLLFTVQAESKMLAALFLLPAIAAAQSESVPLFNAAAPGQTMPAIGLGTGAYGATHNIYNQYPECMMEIAGCGSYAIEAVKLWLSVGGRRLDAADSYDTQTSVGKAMAQSGVARSDIFVLQKTGNWNPMGFEDTLSVRASACLAPCSPRVALPAANTPHARTHLLSHSNLTTCWSR
jgi:hypothetical protein